MKINQKTKKEVIEAFIICIQERRPIWDLKDVNHKNYEVVCNNYAEILTYLKGSFSEEILIATELSDEKQLKTKYRNLRSNAMKECRNRKTLKSGSGLDDVKKKWIWADALSFLLPKNNYREDFADDSMVKPANNDDRISVGFNKILDIIFYY